MPQRFLRPGITTSDRWNSVSFEAQSFYIRIITLVDDWGRFDGRIPILHGQCFALRSDIDPQRTAALRSELQTSDLIRVYVVDGKEYLQVLRWQERVRGTASKFPDPQESAADGSGRQEKDASIAITPSPSPVSTTPSPAPARRDDRWFPEKLRDEGFIARWQEWEEHCRANGKTLHSAARNAQLMECETHGRDEAMKALIFSLTHNRSYIAWDWMSDAEKRKNGTNANQPTTRNVGHNAGVSYANRPVRPPSPMPADHPASENGHV